MDRSSMSLLKDKLSMITQKLKRQQQFLDVIVQTMDDHLIELEREEERVSSPIVDISDDDYDEGLLETIPSPTPSEERQVAVVTEMDKGHNNENTNDNLCNSLTSTSERQVVLKDQLHIPSTSNCSDQQLVVATGTGRNYGKADGNSWETKLHSSADSEVVLKDQQIPSTSSCLDAQVVVTTTDTGHNYGNPWDCNLRSAADRKVVLKDDLPEEDLPPAATNNWTVVHSFKRMKRTTGNLSIPPASKQRVPETENWDNDLLDIPLPSKRSFKAPRFGNSGCPCCLSRTKARCGCPGYCPDN